MLSQSDIAVVEVGVDPGLQPIPRSQLSTVIGKRAATDIAAGTLLSAAQVTDAVVPPSGMSLVGVALSAGGMPGEPLAAGDDVRIVTTPGQDGQLDRGDPEAVAASVVSVAVSAETGQRVVTVQVPEGDAAGLAAKAATGNVALVLDSRER